MSVANVFTNGNAQDLGGGNINIDLGMTGVAVNFINGRAYNNAKTTSKRQVREKDSAGADYIYTKANKRTVKRPMIFEAADQATCDAALSFFDVTADGTKLTWTWVDYADNTIHTVRFAENGMKAVPIGGGLYNIQVTLEEYL